MAVSMLGFRNPDLFQLSMLFLIVLMWNLCCDNVENKEITLYTTDNIGSAKSAHESP